MQIISIMCCMGLGSTALTFSHGQTVTGLTEICWKTTIFRILPSLLKEFLLVGNPWCIDLHLCVRQAVKQ